MRKYLKYFRSLFGRKIEIYFSITAPKLIFRKDGEGIGIMTDVFVRIND